MQLTGSHTGTMFKRYSKCVIKRRLQKILHPGMTMQCMICNDDDDDDENGGDYDGDTMMVISIMMKPMTKIRILHSGTMAQCTNSLQV